MQYLGSKQRIAPWILDEIQASFPRAETVIDLMSGSGAISHEANVRGLDVVANDIQPYSYSVLHSAFIASRTGLDEMRDRISRDAKDQSLLAGREQMAHFLAVEDGFVADLSRGEFDWSAYRSFCLEVQAHTFKQNQTFDLFSTYYPNTYFGVRQCLEIDYLCQRAATSPDNSKSHVVASLISSMSFTSSSTTHLAQFLKPRSEMSARHLLLRRSRSLINTTLERLNKLETYPLPERAIVTNLPFQAAITNLPKVSDGAVLYVDPPYFKEHYSRYYHVLDTLALYDYPALTFNNRLKSITVGRYRENRIVSEFGLRSRVKGAFQELFSLAKKRELRIALSYASTSLLNAEEIGSLAAEEGYVSTLKTIALRHSGQGQRDTISEVTEYLFLMDHA